MPGKWFWRWGVMVLALTPMGCRAFCDHWYPCHPACPSYPAPSAMAPCCPQPVNPCCAPVGVQPTNAYQQGSWAVPQTRLSPNCCE